MERYNHGKCLLNSLTSKEPSGVLSFINVTILIQLILSCIEHLGETHLYSGDGMSICSIPDINYPIYMSMIYKSRYLLIQASTYKPMHKYSLILMVLFAVLFQAYCFGQSHLLTKQEQQRRNTLWRVC